VQVRGVDGDEGLRNSQSPEAEVLWERDGECFKEREDQRVREPGWKR
jgi:hypothetical protein